MKNYFLNTKEKSKTKLTEKQKEAIVACSKLLSSNHYELTARFLESQFPEAFVEPKPERESIDVRIEYNKMAKDMLLLSKSGLIYAIRKSVNNFCTDREATVTELPAPEDNGWTDELVMKFAEYTMENWLGSELTYNEMIVDFKTKHDIK